MNIKDALSAGYTAEQILKYLSKAFPDLGEGIKNALSLGKPVEEILKYVSKIQPKEAQKMQQSRQQNPHLRAKQSYQDYSGVSDLVKGGANLAVLGAGAYGLARGLPALARTGIGQNLLSKFKLGQKTPTLDPFQGSTEPNIQSPDMQQQSGSQQSYKTTPSQTPLDQKLFPRTGYQPEAPINQYRAESKKVAEGIISELGIDKTLKNVSTEGKNLEQISKDVLSSMSEKQKKQYEAKRNAGEAKPMVALLKDYFGQAEGETGLETPEKGVKETLANMPQPEPERLEKGAIAALPNGLTGEVKSIRNGEALIEDEGKLHKVKAKDLQMPDEHIATTVARLLEIPEVDKSSVLNYWAYDPDDNELFIMYHNGETYRYKEVDPGLVKELEEAAATPKTQGENAFGAWSPEDKLSRGATAIKSIIANPKYKKPKKGEEINKFYKKLRKGYDYWSALRK